MNKQTKHIKKSIIKNRKNKTRKYYGGSKYFGGKTEGIFDIIGTKLSGYSGNAFNYIKEKGLRLAGLQLITPLDNTNADLSACYQSQSNSYQGHLNDRWCKTPLIFVFPIFNAFAASTIELNSLILFISKSY